MPRRGAANLGELHQICLSLNQICLALGHTRVHEYMDYWTCPHPGFVLRSRLFSAQQTSGTDSEALLPRALPAHI